MCVCECSSVGAHTDAVEPRAMSSSSFSRPRKRDGSLFFLSFLFALAVEGSVSCLRGVCIAHYRVSCYYFSVSRVRAFCVSPVFEYPASRVVFERTRRNSLPPSWRSLLLIFFRFRVILFLLFYTFMCLSSFCNCVDIAARWFGVKGDVKNCE